jgi:CubicO group peptidase (beta-lactamase class C family)
MDSSVSTKIKEFLELQVASDDFSGSVLVMHDKLPILEYSFGFSNNDKNERNTIDTIYNIGSMDKMFTAVAIAQLVEQKKISFEDEVSKYFPQYPNGEITIDQILTHKDGLKSYFNDKYIKERLNLKTVNDFIDLFIHESLLFEPGEKYQYSNSGYVLLGGIIEKVTGMSYYDYVCGHVFKPSNMIHTGSYAIDDANNPVAHGYTNRLPFSKNIAEGERRDNISDLPYRGSPAGGGYSTSIDLYNFSQALLGYILLSKKMTGVILSPKVTIGTKDSTTLYYGYGFQILKSGKQFRYGHAGGFAGVNTRLDMYPNLNYVSVVLSNYDEPAAFRVANKIGEIIGF